MAKVANTAKQFNFAVEINGLNQFLVQSIELPEITQDVVEHGDTNYTVGTPGRIKTGDCKMEMLQAAPNADTWAWDWFNAGQDPFTGGGALAGDLKRMVVVRQLDPSGLIALKTYIMEGCFVTVYNPNKFDRMSSDNIMETVTLHVDRMRQL